MDSVDSRKRRSLRWAWILLIPSVLGAAFCVTFGPFLHARGIARRLEAQGVQLTDIRRSNTWFNRIVRTIPGFKGYGSRYLSASINCGNPATRADLPQIAKDLRILNLELQVHLTDSTNLNEDLRVLGANRVVGLTAIGCVVTSTDLKLLQRPLQLRDLNLIGCQLDEAAFQEISRMKNLYILGLEGSTITDEGLKHFKGFKNLIALSLSNTQTSEEAKQELQKALPKMELTDD